jgi:aminoglycoside phosphotransferase (APT) family kinase protein
MHPDQLTIDLTLVAHLITEQFPQWADLLINPIESAGTDNAIFKLGDKMCVRLPLSPRAKKRLEKEAIWLPKIAPQLPLQIPKVLGVGTPSEIFPWQWAIYNWIEGDIACRDNILDGDQAARDLAKFVVALQKIDAAHGPPPGLHNFFRGEPLANRDEAVRKAISDLNNLIDSELAISAWEMALNSPEFDGEPVWIHGDLHETNLLAVDGRISAVIDFGGLGVGDPACDLLVAWWLFSNNSRNVFRIELAVDDATWARGQGWALSMGLIALPYYKDSNLILAGMARRAIDEVLGE